MSTPTVPPVIPKLGPSRRSRRRGPKFFWRRVAVVGVFALITGILGSGLGLAARDLFAPAPIGKSARTNVLIVGLDPKGASQADKSRRQADSLALLSVDRTTRQAYMVAIPRNTQALLGHAGSGMLGDAPALGGISFLKDTVAAVTGLPVDYAIEIDQAAAEALAGDFGKTSIYLPTKIQWDDKASGIALDLPEGDRTLSPDQALAFGAYEAPDAPLERIRRQELLLHAWHTKLHGLWGWWGTYLLSRDTSKFGVTDLSAQDVSALAGLIRQVAPEDVTYAVLPGDEDGDRYVVSDTRLDVLQQKLSAPPSQLPIGESKPTLEILYDNPGDDQVMNLATKLTNAGFQVIRTSRAPVDQSESVLYDRAKPGVRSEAIVRGLAEAVHGVRIEDATEPVTAYGAQYTLELGKGFFH